MICDSDAVYGLWRFLRQPGTWFRWWFMGLMGLSFPQWFVILSPSLGAEDFCVSWGTGFRGWFVGWLRLSCRQWFAILTQSMGGKDLCVSPELGSGDDLWVGWDSVFVNDFLFWHSLWALKISASARNMVPVMIYGSDGTQFLSMICDSNAAYGRWRFLR